ncbi:nuclear transport factor 2 family protein [Phytomonospora sp. NPDC050363]|uniref:nuclear transport factor 2 family protein n=1 Tax=Phytomonospora sp. NPDC050363 TaxID=3155642 RepID=UPI00340574D5
MAPTAPYRRTPKGRDVRAVFADIDTFDPARFVAHLTEDAEFRFANAPVVKGREAIGEAVAAFFATIDGLTHHVHHVWEVGDTSIAQTDVEYRRKDGRTVIVPNADILVFEGELARDWRIYIDLAPLYAEVT